MCFHLSLCYSPYAATSSRSCLRATTSRVRKEIGMKTFEGKIAVITGGGCGMGGELALQLVAMGCDVAMCDVFPEGMEETKRRCLSQARQRTRVTTFLADVSVEDQVL